MRGLIDVVRVGGELMEQALLAHDVDDARTGIKAREVEREEADHRAD